MAVAVVVGGSAGLGRAVVRELADAGWDVAVIAREIRRLAATVAEVQERGRRGLWVSTDVADGHGVEDAAPRIERELGPIDLWINGPIGAVHGEFLDVDPADFERVTDVTYHGLVNGTRAALSRMVPRNRGHVIQISSALAHRGLPLLSAYCAAKAASRIFTESVTTELLHHRSRIRISQIDMPALDTPFYSWSKSLMQWRARPVPIVFEPETAARVVMTVVRHPRRRTWVGEPTLAAIVGNRLSGRTLDRLAATFGYRAQKATGERDPMLPPNLNRPVPADVATRGAFGDKAVSMSPQVWAITHRRTLSAVGAAVAAAAVGAVALQGPVAPRRRR
ncbi:SDR family oxidoreductase [Agromyces sp. Marseille-P2726]|uniref:SDR family oxidoreductase n=1 Tax=Agromyces sp. Marseille-P2726 TaxID=2709132 RepID=UPI001570B5CB|nr:SDR family oxidoreductase [Agromyces sp. Marseille-P2726]